MIFKLEKDIRCLVMSEKYFEVEERYKDGTTFICDIKAENCVEAMKIVLDSVVSTDNCVGVRIKEVRT